MTSETTILAPPLLTLLACMALMTGCATGGASNPSAAV